MASRPRPEPIPPWLPCYLALLVAASVTPLSFVSVAQPLTWHAVPLDVGLNVLCYLPLGWAMRSRPLWLAILTSLLLSVSVETTQRFLIRTPAGWDVLANLCGAALGASLAKPPVTFAKLLARPGTFAVMLATAAVAWPSYLAVTAANIPSMGPQRWEQAQLWLGTSANATTGFQGRLLELRIFDHFPRTLGSTWLTGGPVLHLTADPSALYIDGPSGRKAIPLPRMLHVADGAFVLPNPGVRLPQAAARHLLHRTGDTGNLTVWAHFEARPTAPSQQAALFDLSGGVAGSYFTLMRGPSWLSLRVPGPQQLPHAVGPASPLLDSDTHTVLASFDGHWARLIVDGQLASERYLPAWLQPWSIGEGATLSIVIAVILAALAVAGLWPARRGRWLGMLLASSLSYGGLWGFGLQDHHGETVGTALLACFAALACLPLGPHLCSREEKSPAQATAPNDER